jgi:hypothetical protein
MDEYTFNLIGEKVKQFYERVDSEEDIENECSTVIARMTTTKTRNTLRKLFPQVQLFCGFI